MPADEVTLDKLRSLCGLARGLADICEIASNNADSANVGSDPLMAGVRRQFLNVRVTGGEFLSVDRPPITRHAGSALVAQYEADTAESWPSGIPSGTLSLTGWRNVCFANGIIESNCVSAWEAL